MSGTGMRRHGNLLAVSLLPLSPQRWLLESERGKTMRNMSVWHDAAAAVSPKLLSWTLDIGQAESQFLFQKCRSNYLLFKVTFLSMALESSLFVFVFFFMSHFKWTKCLLYCLLFLLSTAGKLLHSDNHSLTEYIITMKDNMNKVDNTGTFFSVLLLLHHYSEKDLVNT